jgi:hypothetical protein
MTFQSIAFVDHRILSNFPESLFTILSKPDIYSLIEMEISEANNPVGQTQFKTVRHSRAFHDHPTTFHRGIKGSRGVEL